MKRRRLFCEISPLTYRISVGKMRMLRRLKNLFSGARVARKRDGQPLPELIYTHNSLIRRKLGDVDPVLQENKAVNLSLAAPRVNGVLIRPGETFSFWSLVGSCSERKGYREGLTITRGAVGRGIGGGMCQFTNLIHWMALHTELRVVEHHHHDGLDLFPDNGRQIPFGTGTSIMYNYLDYRLYNPTAATYQLMVCVDGEYLKGQIRADRKQTRKFHIHAEQEFFSEEDGAVYRNGEIWRSANDLNTGELILRELIKKNHAKVAYDRSFIPAERFRTAETEVHV